MCNDPDARKALRDSDLSVAQKRRLIQDYKEGRIEIIHGQNNLSYRYVTDGASHAHHSNQQREKQNCCLDCVGMCC